MNAVHFDLYQIDVAMLFMNMTLFRNYVDYSTNKNVSVGFWLNQIFCCVRVQYTLSGKIPNYEQNIRLFAIQHKIHSISLYNKDRHLKLQ